MIMIPTNSPTQGQPKPRKVRLKVAFGPYFFSPQRIIFGGLGFILYRKQTATQPPTNFSANTLVLFSSICLTQCRLMQLAYYYTTVGYYHTTVAYYLTTVAYYHTTVAYQVLRIILLQHTIILLQLTIVLLQRTIILLQHTTYHTAVAYYHTTYHTTGAYYHTTVVITIMGSLLSCGRYAVPGTYQQSSLLFLVKRFPSIL